MGNAEPFSGSQPCSIQFSTVTQSCLTLWEAMNHSTPGRPVHPQLPEFTQTHVHWAGEAIQTSHLLLSPPPASSSVVSSSRLHSFPASESFQMSQFFSAGGQVLEFQLQQQCFQWIFRTGFLLDGLVGSPYSPRDSQDSSPTPQFKSINSSALSFLYSPTLTSVHDYWKNHSFDLMDLCWQSNVSAFEYAI